MILQAPHTHLYPGLRGRVSGVAAIAGTGTRGDCVVEFSDGSAAAASLSRQREAWHLDTGAYRTAAGTDIPAKGWLLRLRQDGAGIEFRIVAKTKPRASAGGANQ